MNEPADLGRLRPLQWPGYYYDPATLRVYSAKRQGLRPLTLQKFKWRRDYRDGRLKKELCPHYQISVNNQNRHVDVVYLERLRYKENQHADPSLPTG